MANLLYPLPDREKRLFDKLSKQFDAREYADAVKLADQILSSVPDHGETLAMKGLTLHSMEKKQEGLALVKEGVSKAMKSTLVWHSLGMIHRADKNMPEALKAFKVAAKCDPKNANVLRDLSSACIQMRDWETMFETREKLLGIKSNLRPHWIGLSCAYKMLGQTELAAAIMDVMAGIMDLGDNAVEVSETQMYRVELELANNAPQKALDLLNQDNIVDDLTKLKLRAKAHALLGQREKAEKLYMELIGKNFAEGDSILAIAALRKIVMNEFNLPKTDNARYVELLDQVRAAFPKCDYAARVALDCVPLEELESRLVAYVTPFIRKMIPSLFSVLKTLYRSAERAAVVEKVFLRWAEELNKGDFSSFSGESNPAFIMWVNTYLASHFTRVKNFAKAHEHINLAIDHTPTIEMLYLLRAKIYHREGNFAKAAEEADRARKLDLQDKYMNSKCAKYQFRAGLIDEAERTMQLFYKPSTVNDTYLIALESQCAWYEREVGDAFFHKGDLISALQNYLMYEKHHKDNHDELADFHGYVFRRCNMRAWFDVIARDDGLDSNAFFLKICPQIVRTYLKVAELGEAAVRAAHVPRPDIPPTGVEEDDKRREQLRADFYLTVDTTEPLVKANRYVEALLKNRWNDALTHQVAVDYFLATDRLVLAAASASALAKMNDAQASSKKAAVLAKVGSHVDARIADCVRDALK